jgi:hypothetical protein
LLDTFHKKLRKIIVPARGGGGTLRAPPSMLASASIGFPGELEIMVKIT